MSVMSAEPQAFIACWIFPAGTSRSPRITTRNSGFPPLLALACPFALAAFNTGTDLPTKKTRVARLMVHIEGSAQPQYTAQLLVAASTDAKPISATISVMEGTNQ